MQANVETQVISAKVIWTGRITSAVPVLLILLGATMKLMMLPPVLEGFARSGYSEHLVFPIGLIELICAIVYLIPRTSVLGAILLTALLGGATATNVRVSDPTWVVTIILGIMVWAGLYLRDQRLRSLIPLRS
jgi:hypothetical protein